jgi:hypothetical protein
MIKEFRTIVVVSPFADGTYWYLRENLRWLSAAGEEYVVPRGFVTDFASIPRPFWWLLPKWARYGSASIVHDFNYWEQKYDRKTADRAMVEGMKDLNVGGVTRAMIYFFLRLFGGFAWRNNRKKNEAGFIRVIVDFPTDPSETWKRYQNSLKQKEPPI